MEDKKVQEFLLKVASLLGAEKDGCSTQQVKTKYEEFCGKKLELPPQFSSLEDFLKCTAAKQFIEFRHGRWFAVKKDNVAHVIDLVRRTKKKMRKHRSQYVVSQIKEGRQQGSITVKTKFAETIHDSRRVSNRDSRIVKPDSFDQRSVTVHNAEESQSASCIGSRSLSVVHDEDMRVNLFWKKPCSTCRSSGVPQIRKAEARTARDSFASSNSSNKPSLVQPQDNASQKGRKRIVSVLRQAGGELTLKEFAYFYEKTERVRLCEEEIRKLFGLNHGELIDLKELLRDRLRGWVNVDIDESGELYLSLFNGDLTGESDDDFAAHVEPNQEAFTSFCDKQFQQKRFDQTLRFGYPSSDMMHDFRHDASSSQHFSRFPSSTGKVTSAQLVDVFHELESSDVPTVLRKEESYGDWNESLEWRKTSAVDKELLSYQAIGDSILKYVSQQGPLEINTLSSFLYDEFGVVVEATSFKEENWLEIVKAVIKRRKHSGLCICNGKVGLKEDFGNRVFHNDEYPFDDNYNLYAVAQKVYNLLMMAPTGRLSLQEIIDSPIGFSTSSIVEVQHSFEDVFEWDFDNGAILSLKPGAVLLKRTDDGISNYQPGAPLSKSGDVSRVKNHCLFSYKSEEARKQGLREEVVLCDLHLDLINAGLFTFRVSFLLKDPYLLKKRDFFQQEIEHFYAEHWNDSKWRISNFEEGLYCVVFDDLSAHANHYYRAEILRLKGSFMVVSLIDYARVMEHVCLKNARLLKPEFLHVAAFGVDIATELLSINPNKTEKFKEKYFGLRDLFLKTKETVYAEINFKPEINVFELSQLYVDDYFSIPLYFIKKNLVEYYEEK